MKFLLHKQKNGTIPHRNCTKNVQKTRLMLLRGVKLLLKVVPVYTGPMYVSSLDGLEFLGQPSNANTDCGDLTARTARSTTYARSLITVGSVTYSNRVVNGSGNNVKNLKHNAKQRCFCPQITDTCPPKTRLCNLCETFAGKYYARMFHGSGGSDARTAGQIGVEYIPLPAWLDVRMGTCREFSACVTDRFASLQRRESF